MRLNGDFWVGEQCYGGEEKIQRLCYGFDSYKMRCVV